MQAISHNTEEKKTVLQVIKNPFIALGFICFSMLFTVKHSVLLYFMSTGVSNPSILEYLFTGLAIAVLDGSIIVLTAHGQRKASQVFSFVIFLINLFYFWHDQVIELSNAMVLIPGLLWALCFSYIIFYYGELFVSLNKTEDTLEKKNLELSQLRNKLGKIQAEAEKTRKEAEKNVGGAETWKSEAEKLNRELEKALSELETYGNLAEKYKSALEIVGKSLEKPGLQSDTLRKKSTYWRKKYEENGLSPEEKIEALVKVDGFNYLYQKAKSN